MNSKLQHILISLAFILLLGACQSSKQISVTENSENHKLKKPVALPLQYPKDKLYDILHTKLELSFDWTNQQVNGQANLKIKPIFYDIDKIILDAKSMDIENVFEVTSDTLLPLFFTYNNKKLVITLSSILKSDHSIDVHINYTARPNTFTEPLEPENKGLFFVNPLDTAGGPLRQIWTQGETFYNSIWFPTQDRPDEKFTHEIFLTVDSNLATLSNGQLVYSLKHDNGTKTDYWHQAEPISPYLVVCAVGDWEVIELPSSGVPLNIYSEKSYSEVSKEVFKNTAEMLSFFETTFGYEYPWAKYSQLPVREFITGAMENASASIFMDDLYTDLKSLNDENYDWIISHELAHQWFGDLVTCKNWHNISLNEGFANYSEYLWSDFKYGEEKAGLVRIAELDEYFSAAKSNPQAIVRKAYRHPGDLFDANSYSKAGLVLHMLRNELGDEAFFVGIKKYLNQYAHKNTELSDLRQVFEDLTGKNLENFFDQWFGQAGHPYLKIHVVDSVVNNPMTITISQQQNEIFRFPLTLRMHAGESYLDTIISMTSRERVLKLAKPKDFKLVYPDPERVLLAEFEINYSFEQLEALYQNESSFLVRYDAIDKLLSKHREKTLQTGFTSRMLYDSSDVIKELALDFILEEYKVLGASLSGKISDIYKSANSSYCRASALAALYHFDLLDSTQLNSALSDKSWYVNATALDIIFDQNKPMSEKTVIANAFDEVSNPHIVSALARFYTDVSEKDNTDWFIRRLNSAGNEEKYVLLSYFGPALLKSERIDKKEHIEYLFNLASNETNINTRVMAFQSLLYFVDDKNIKMRVLAILEQENADELKDWIQRYF